jgi:hypothetical protein
VAAGMGRGEFAGYYGSLRALTVAVRARARSHRRFALPLNHFTPHMLTYSVPLFLKRQCDHTLRSGPFSSGTSTPTVSTSINI